MRSMTFSVTILRTSGFVRQSWLCSFWRLPFTSLKYSGCASKYFSDGMSRWKV